MILQKQDNIKAFIFDMDGVITDTMPYHYKSWKQVLSEEGICISKYDVYSREGQKGITAIREIFDSYDIEYDDKRAERLLDKKEKLFVDFLCNTPECNKASNQQNFNVELIEGSEDLLQWLHNLKYRLALVSGTSRRELLKILPEHLYNLFSVVVTGSDVKKGKPNPEPYLEALKSLHIGAQEAIVIENAPLGIKSAKAAGLRCIAIETSLSKEYLAEADYIFPSIPDLRGSIDLSLRNIS